MELVTLKDRIISVPIRSNGMKTFLLLCDHFPDREHVVLAESWKVCRGASVRSHLVPLCRLGVAEFLLVSMVDRKWREALSFTTREPAARPNDYLTDVHTLKTYWATHVFYFFMSLQEGHIVFSSELFNGTVRLTDYHVCSSVFVHFTILSLVLHLPP